MLRHLLTAITTNSPVKPKAPKESPKEVSKEIEVKTDKGAESKKEVNRSKEEDKVVISEVRKDSGGVSEKKVEEKKISEGRRRLIEYAIKKGKT